MAQRVFVFRQQLEPHCLSFVFKFAAHEAHQNDKLNNLFFLQIFRGISLCVVSPYEEPQIDSYRGADAGKVFTLKLESLGKELNKKIKNADAKMIFTDDDKKVFKKNATHCHICEGAGVLAPVYLQMCLAMAFLSPMHHHKG